MTPPITLVATITATPTSRDAVEAALIAAAAATVDEPGCEQYSLHRDAHDANRFVMLERWLDQASLDRHADAPAFRTLAAVLNGNATLQVARYVPIP